MFKFDFDIETGEARMTDDSPLGSERTGHVAGIAQPDSTKEGFQEVLFSEANARLNLENPPTSICETLGVKHISAPIVSKDDYVFQQTEQLGSDLIPRVYEGGYKIWESTVDLLNVMGERPELVRDLKVLDLGCGAGLVGLRALMDGAASVHFHDYNASVLRSLTIPNVGLLPSTSSTGDIEKKVRFFAGDWTLFENPTKYDVILTSETIYRRENYTILCDLFDRCLLPDTGRVVVAAKSIYFGVGGTMAEFSDCCLQRGWKIETLLRVDRGVNREVILLSK